MLVIALPVVFVFRGTPVVLALSPTLLLLTTRVVTGLRLVAAFVPCLTCAELVVVAAKVGF